MSEGMFSNSDTVESDAPATSDPEESLKKEIFKAQRHWGTTPERSLFWATSNIEDNLPAGLYKCTKRDDVGTCFQQIKIETDALVRLPDMICNEVIEQITMFWSDRVKEEMKKRGFLHKRGILMYGEPGSGKTCTIQMLIQMLIHMDGIAIYGEDPHLLADCLQMLRRIEPTRPIIVVLEDFDTLTGRDPRENTWLSMLDGESQVSNVVFLATTNYIQKLDKRFIDRPSRFDLIMRVPMPSARARAAYIKFKEPEIGDDELYDWVQESEHFSIAHLKEMILSIRCYNKTLRETVERLNTQRKRDYSNDDLEAEARGSGGIGFKAGTPTSTFADRETFDEFMKELEEWDWGVGAN